MSSKQGIWVDGERELFLNMQRTLDGSIKAGMKGLESAALNIIADAKENLRGNESVVTGQLRASGRVQRAQDDDQALDAGFFSHGESGHAAYVEYGTRAGGKRTIKNLLRWILPWVQKKLRLSGNEAKTRAFFISRKIVKRGTKPHPFLGPAVEKNQKQISEAITFAIQDAIR